MDSKIRTNLEEKEDRIRAQGKKRIWNESGIGDPGNRAGGLKLRVEKIGRAGLEMGRGR